MKNNIYNPLFESLLKKVNDYENPQGISEQDGAVKGTIFSDYMKAMSQLGSKLVAQYANAIQTYPKTAVKTEYMKTFTDKLKAIESSIDITKTPSIQLDALFNNVKTEATAFFGLGAKEDKNLVKYLEPWRDAFRTGFQLYTQAFKSLMEYVKKQEESGQAKISETEKGMMKAGVSKFIASLTASFEKNKTITDTKWGEPVVGESLVRDNSVIEKLIQNKICVDFNTFNTVVNEAKEDRIARRAAKSARVNIEVLQANISNVLNQIGGRLGDPAKANFKSLAMAPEFNKIANTLVSIQDELSIDRSELKNVQFDDLDKQIANLTDLFKTKKDSYDKTYSEEEKTLRSSKTLEIATPEVAKFIADGDAQFDALSDLAQNGANLFSADIEKAKQDKSQADKIKGKSQPKNPGKKDGEVQKGQDGADWKWDAKAKVWNKVEVADPVSTSNIKIASPIKKGAKGDQVKAVQQLIMDKMGTKLKDVPQYKKFAKYGADGIFGGSTASLVPAMKGALGLKDTSSDITQELVDKLSAVIKESFVFEQDFDMDVFNKIIGSGGGGDTKPAKGSSGAGSPINSAAFKCIKAKETTEFAMKGGKAVVTRATTGNIHEFKADGSYRIYIKSEDKWKRGVWSCAGNSYQATIEGGEVYLGDYQNFKSEIDKSQKVAAEAAAKKAAEQIASARVICQILLQAMAGASEDEGTVYKTFQDKITTKEMFNTVEAQWNSLWPSKADMNGTMISAKSKSWEELKKACAFTGTKNGFSFRNIFTQFFSSSEIARLNQYLPAGVKAI
jgi:peptidoglycan hydrolase-like protein with peptidoglycan-binding domain